MRNNSVQNMQRPICQVAGCDKFAQNTNTTASPRWRKSKWVREKFDVVEGYICCTHHYEHTGKKHGLSSASEFSRMVLKGGAERSGYANTTEYLNSKHPYRKFRKDYCENRDGRLGFVCTYTPPPVELIEQRLNNSYYEGWLDVDHKDGNPLNNTEENLQTLCKCCHNFKTLAEGDYATAGRKTLRKQMNGKYESN